MGLGNPVVKYGYTDDCADSAVFRPRKWRHATHLPGRWTEHFRHELRDGRCPIDHGLLDLSHDAYHWWGSGYFRWHSGQHWWNCRGRRCSKRKRKWKWERR